MSKRNKSPVKDIITITAIGGLGYLLLTHPQMSKKGGAAGGRGEDNGEEKESIADIVLDELGGVGIDTSGFHIHIPGTTTTTGGTDFGFLDLLAGLDLSGDTDVTYDGGVAPTPTPEPDGAGFTIPDLFGEPLELPSLRDILTTIIPKPYGTDPTGRKWHIAPGAAIPMMTEEERERYGIANIERRIGTIIDSFRKEPKHGASIEMRENFIGKSKIAGNILGFLYPTHKINVEYKAAVKAFKASRPGSIKTESGRTSRVAAFREKYNIPVDYSYPITKKAIKVT